MFIENIFKSCLKIISKVKKKEKKISKVNYLIHLKKKKITISLLEYIKIKIIRHLEMNI